MSSAENAAGHMSPESTRYQNIVDAISTRAKITHFGCGEPEQSLKIAELSSEGTAEMAALTLVSAFHAKYDLVALMQAAIEMIDNGQDHRPLPESAVTTPKITMENTKQPEHTTGSGSCASPCSAVVEIAGDNVSVTLHQSDVEAEAFAVAICMENTAYAEHEIREHFKHRSDHAEGDYRVALEAACFISPNIKDEVPK